MYSEWQDTADPVFLWEEYFRGLAWTVNQIRKLWIFSAAYCRSSQCSKFIAGSTECLINV